jgi:hypothetical protein
MAVSPNPPKRRPHSRSYQAVMCATVGRTSVWAALAPVAVSDDGIDGYGRTRLNALDGSVSLLANRLLKESK